MSSMYLKEHVKDLFYALVNEHVIMCSKKDWNECANGGKTFFPRVGKVSQLNLYQTGQNQRQELFYVAVGYLQFTEL